MIAKNVLKRVSLGGVLMFVFMGLGVSNASAHVTVKPGEVTTATYQVFTVNVPNEKDIATTQVRVVVPNDVGNVMPTQKAGWAISMVKEGDAVKEITWSGSEIAKGLRDEFSFSAKTPAQAGELKWKAYQTYADGTVVAWDQDESHSNGIGHDDEQENSGPLSVTSVVATQDDQNVASSDEVNAAKADAQRSLYVAITAALLAVIALFFATRKRRQ